MGYGITKKNNRYYAYVNFDGKKKYVEGGGYLARKEADAAGAEYYYKVTKGLIKINRSISVNELIQYYLDRCGNCDYSVQQTRGRCNKYVIPKLGKIKLNRLSKNDIESLKDDLSRKGGTMPHAVMCDVRKILNWAVGRDIITTYPVFKIPPSPRRKKIPPVKTEEIMDLLPKLELKPRLIVALGGCCGLRPGEIVGLKMADIDYKNKRIWPTQQHTHGEITTPKTDESEEFVTLPPFMIPWLKEYIKALGLSTWLFPSPRKIGNPITYGGFENREWKQIREKYGLHSRMRLHDLRHSYGYNVYRKTRDIKVVQRMMRHRSIKTTFDEYGYVFEEDMQEAAEVYKLVENLVEGKDQVQ